MKLSRHVTSFALVTRGKYVLPERVTLRRMNYVKSCVKVLSK